MKEAFLYEKLTKKIVHCYLCSHHCRIANRKFGFCGVRENVEGTLYTHAYGNVVAAQVDPIEKKPLYHFLPGSKSFSIAALGCNFRCSFCQNWEISQQPNKSGANLQEEEFLPADIAEEALKNDCQSISYTYTEPTIFFEYAYETAQAAKESGLCNIFVTNGYMTKECITMIKPYLDAANIDLKFFNDASYQKNCAGRLKPVLDSIRLMKELGIWVEVTTLVIPGENDSEAELSGIADFLAGVDKAMPWHISRFHPDYKFRKYGLTPEDTLKKAYSIGVKAGLDFIYIGNVSGWGNDTLCPSCKKILIKREYFNILEYNIQENKCIYCQKEVPGVFKG
ncbi:MAG: AmmeMemoRadiSam system radical SAM enzyme [Candidatus Omnitrophota bacterium]|nr:AmmeMemoRadiSam system radical SAM enzyme [Candidatus Omnitrophota bacterium]